MPSSLGCFETRSLAAEYFILLELKFLLSLVGAPGSSSVVGVKRSSGGLVSFDGLCSGQYF